jgi:Flp pilus assembly pilin Flp
MVPASHFIGKRLPDNTSPMNHITRLYRLVRLWRDRRGQDLVEYALMAGFVAVAAGGIMPSVSISISAIFSEIGSVMTVAANQGS